MAKVIQIDDLYVNQPIEIDCGSDCVVGAYKGIHCRDGKWFITVLNKKGKQIVPTKDVVRILKHEKE